MTDEERMKAICLELINIASNNDPKGFCGALLGTLASTVGNLPDDYFEKMVNIEPCGRVGCDCHLGLQAEGAKFLRYLRSDFQTYVNPVEVA